MRDLAVAAGRAEQRPDRHRDRDGGQDGQLAGRPLGIGHVGIVAPQRIAGR